MKRLGLGLVAAAVLGLSVAAWARQEAPAPAWEVKLAQRHEELIATNGPGTDDALRATLLTMVREDQQARFQNIHDVDAKKPTDAHELVVLDKRLTDELRGIVAKNGWPTIHLVGMEASNGAMLVLTHSADHAWQRELLPKLEVLAREGKIDGSALALVVDKELVAAGKLQRYGTQFKFVDGQAMMYAVEDPAGLEKRREEVLLMPMDAYKQKLGEMYHLPVSDVIIRADTPK